MLISTSSLKTNENKNNSNKSKSNDSVFEYITQLGMIACMLVIFYKLVYRPVVLGVDLVPYTLLNVSIVYLFYGLFNGMYKGVVMYKDYYSLKYADSSNNLYVNSTSSFILIINILCFLKFYDISILINGLSFFYTLLLFVVCFLHMCLIAINNTKIKIKNKIKSKSKRG